MLALLLLFLIPFFMAVIVLGCAKLLAVNIRNIAFIASLVPLVFLVLGADHWYMSSFDHPWLPTLGVRFHLAVDNLSLIFLYLVNIIIPITVVSMRPQTIRHASVFYALILLLQGLLIGFFTAGDLLLFTFFFEALLLPAYFLISGWGDDQKENAAFTFIIYMIAGSALMIAGVLSLYFSASTFDIVALTKTAQSVPLAAPIAFVFLLAFAVKTPMFPLHGWLIKSYYHAPVAATILLSALLSKAGIYGIIRVSMGLFPNLMQQWSPILLTLSIVGVLYGALAAWAVSDYKKVIAYSSFSHVNFILVGLFAYNEMATSGAIFQAVNHAITITGLFLVAAWLETRLNTTHFGKTTGLARYMPKLAWLTLFFILSSVALPGLNNFISEAMLLYGLFQVNMWRALVVGLTIILSVMYMLRWFHVVYFNEPSKLRSDYRDISRNELLIALPLVVLIIWLGLYPKPVLTHVVAATTNIQTLMSHK
jgi:NADH-quinone oxidoreductase subunit M